MLLSRSQVRISPLADYWRATASLPGQSAHGPKISRGATLIGGPLHHCLVDRLMAPKLVEVRHSERGLLGFMLLKNLMEDKQLDFNQPILSVRRFSSTASSEKNVKRKTDKSLPSLPPLPTYKSELKSGPVRNPGTVPFLWEKSPGRPKDEGKSKTQALERPPKLPPGRITKIKQQAPDKGSEDLSSQNVSSVEENIAKFESSKDTTEEESSDDSGDGDEAYLDALDTLSRTESFFLNCSLSGLSGLDGPEVKPSGTFSTDVQTRDFMMGRFLPAAKAMACETPQYASWKPPVAQEQPSQLRKVISADQRPPVYRSRPNILPNYAEYNREEEESDDEGDDDYNEPGNLSTRVCGLLPRFCLLNPVPGISVRTHRTPMSTLSRTHAKSSSRGQETKNERMRVVTHEQRSIVEPQKPELREHKNEVSNKYNQVPHQSSSQKLEGSFLYRHLQGTIVSPQQNELPQSNFSAEKRFLDISKEAEIDENNKREIGSASPVVEKTLYVDSVHKVVSLKLNSFSSDWKGLPKSMYNDLEIAQKVGGLEGTPLVDPSLKVIEKSNIMDEKVTLQPKSLNHVDSSLLYFSGKSDQEVGKKMRKGFRKDQDLCQESITFTNLKSASNVYRDFEDQPRQLTKVDNVEENNQEINSQFPLPPPLPKSPSESWLWRTLPSMSSKNSSSRSHLGTIMNSRHQASKMASVDPKWETIVKTKKVQHLHVRFSEERLPPVSET
ncbi:hypothetical protein TEA_019003 [Camellia sinensis var. sinensis]|uniref:Uncharacterized protein n=2 Tax=Camellia sinensis TaxID=4442 RepID=A0A4S4EXD1_CAMSN|nr:hypothetical protein TEA_019003 [Camellia sinensis var. sinensis]